jgi:hypothetical protein
LGYSETDAESMTAIAEAEVGAAGATATYLGRARTALFNRAHTEFIGKQLTSSEASAALAAAGVPAIERGPVLTLWTRESELIRTELTQAQIKKAYKRSIITEAEALAELQERGMSQRDADVFLQSG